MSMDSTVIQPRLSELPEQYELSSLQPESGQQTPASTPYSAQSSQAALQAALDDGLTVQELAPLDRGIKAWTFCFSSFVLEMMIWGFCFRCVTGIPYVADWHTVTHDSISQLRYLPR